jgi:hypothetical protein
MGKSLSFSAVLQMRNEWTGTISESYHGFGEQGLCDTSAVPIPWPSTVLPEGRRAFDANITVSARLEGSGAESLAPVVMVVDRAPCPAGTSYDATLRSCSQCLPSQYGGSPAPSAATR